ncbi:MAG TPA: hypothetical protein DEV72_08795 [Ktedonobacter sp.]|jgi:hypothetical protein|nr:hypothetical protein [Ktedonobacter sp.]
MDASTTLTITQAILDWALFGFLLAWMVTFAVLALRVNPTGALKLEELPTPARSFPVTTASMSLHMLTTQPVPVVSHGTSGEMDPVSIA